MAEPLTWLAIQDIVTMLASITNDAGYYTDLGEIPAISDRSQVTEDVESYVAVIAGEITPIPDRSGIRTIASTMDVTIEYALSVDSDATANPELLAHRGRADIVRAIRFDLRGLSKGFTALDITGTRITNAALAGSNFVLAQVSARASLSESKPPAN